MPPKDREPFEGIEDAVVIAQSRAFANQYVLYEVVMTLAREAADPRKCIDDMSERVFERMDQLPTEDPTRAAIEARGAVERFFGNIARNL